MIVQQTPTFSKQKKKLHANQINDLDDAIKQIIKNPKIGEQKKGDLRAVFVYKLNTTNQEFLIAHEIKKENILLLALGAHENFYHDLKARPR